MDLALFLPHNMRMKERGERNSGARSKVDKRKYIFTQHIITLWNLLPQDVREAKSINELKKRKKKNQTNSCNLRLRKSPNWCLSGARRGCRRKDHFILSLFRYPFLSICSWPRPGAAQCLRRRFILSQPGNIPLVPPCGWSLRDQSHLLAGHGTEPWFCYLQPERGPSKVSRGHSVLIQAGVIKARLSPETFRETLPLSLPPGLSAEISVLKPSLNGDGR